MFGGSTFSFRGIHGQGLLPDVEFQINSCKELLIYKYSNPAIVIEKMFVLEYVSLEQTIQSTLYRKEALVGQQYTHT